MQLSVSAAWAWKSMFEKALLSGKLTVGCTLAEPQLKLQFCYYIGHIYTRISPAFDDNGVPIHWYAAKVSEGICDSLVVFLNQPKQPMIDYDLGTMFTS